MRFVSVGRALRGLFFAATGLVVLNAEAQNRTLRIVTYNIQADIGVTNKQPTFTNIMTSAAEGPPLPGLVAPPTAPGNYSAGGVLEGIGEEVVNGNAQPLDILALQETTSNPATVAPIVNALNTFYGVAGMYSNSPYQATESGGNPGVGNGPNALIYNTRTVQLLASVPVDPPGGTSNLGGVSSGYSGEYREVMRYQFAPAGEATNTANSFYIYVSHYKSGGATTANNTNSRAAEAFIIRSNLLTSLPSGARILHVGDFNTGDASEKMYATLTAPGTNALLDPLNPTRSLTTNFDGSAGPGNLTDAATYLQYRDDYQMMTTNIFYGTPGGLALVSGSYHPFGNNGTTAFLDTVNTAGNTSLNNRLVTNGPVFISSAQLLVDLTGASDHLPIVADFTIPLPPPVITNFSLAGTNLIFTLANSITGGVFTVLTSANLSLPRTNWTALATNVANSGTFRFTNGLNPAAPAQFYLFQEK